MSRAGVLIRLSAKRVRHKARRAIQGENEARRECREAGDAKKAAEERECMAKKVAMGRRALDAALSTENGGMVVVVLFVSCVQEHRRSGYK